VAQPVGWIVTEEAPERPGLLPVLSARPAVRATPHQPRRGRYGPGDPLTPTGDAKRALVSIARRWSSLDTEIGELDQAIKAILNTIAAPLLARHGVGFDTAGALLWASNR
jgi:hypothetical protein